MVKKRILVVDDEPAVCRLLSDYLSVRGFEIEMAANGKEALQIIEKAKPDLVILDEMMPVMTGFEFLKHLKSKQDYLGIPVIMLTVRSAPKELGKGISLGANFYLPKPFNLENVMQFIKLTIRDEVS